MVHLVFTEGRTPIHVGKTMLRTPVPQAHLHMRTWLRGSAPHVVPSLVAHNQMAGERVGKRGNPTRGCGKRTVGLRMLVRTLGVTA